MTRQRFHLLVDGLLAVCGLGLLWTGLLLYAVLPAHSRGDTVWTWTRHDWGALHFYLACVMVGLILIHLALNWNWVCQVTYRLFASRSRKLGHVKTVAAGLVVTVVFGGCAAGLVLAESMKVSSRSMSMMHQPENSGISRGWRGGHHQAQDSAHDDPKSRASYRNSQTPSDGEHG